MKKILLVITVLILSLTLFACSSKNKARDEILVVGMEADYAPFNWATLQQSEFTHPIEGQKGTYADGYDVQMAKLIADHMGLELVIKAIEWDGLLPALASKEIDVIIAGMSPTSERKQEIAFSEEYYRSEVVMVVKKNSSYENATTLEDWEGSRVVAQRGTLYDDLIPQISRVTHQTPLDTYSALAVAVDSGTSDAFISELPVAQSVVAANPNLKIVNLEPGKGFDIDDEEITVAVGMRKTDTSRLQEINAALSGITNQQRDRKSVV